VPTFWSLTLSRRVVLNALKVSLVVGTVLNIINQGAAIISWHDIHWGHVALNYLTPYLVATWSAVKNEMDRRKGS
jgi:hypothetical protein